MPQINMKQPGQVVSEFSVTSDVVTVAGVVIDCAARETDEAQIIEIRELDGIPHEGGDGAFLAQVEIPARRYIEEAGPLDADGHPTTVTTPGAFDPNRIVLTLWPAN